jgi:hypothetical protein
MGAQLGPISSTELQYLAQHGTVSRDTLVKKTLEGKWVRAERARGAVRRVE